MASTIGSEERLPSPPRRWLQHWLDVLAAQRAGLRLYQWLWIVLCIIGALVVVAPRVLSQPVIYQTHAAVHFDPTRYGGLYTGEGEPGHDFTIALNDATNTLQQRAMEQRELRFGRPDYRVNYTPLERGTVQVVGTAPTAHEAQTLANNGADELVRHIQAAGGREVLRNLLGWELVAAMREEPITSPFEHHLRQIIATHAFPMSRPIEPVSARMDVEDLTPAERSDMTRALEARYDLWTFEMNTRNATLDALCNTAHLTNTGQREQALATCATISEAAAFELEARNRVIIRRQAISDAIHSMLTTFADTAFTPQQGTIVSSSAAALPAAPVPRYVALSLALAVVVGLVLGALSVALDRSAGVMPKLRELWEYRELIINLVVRELRVRYKGSALGYLWTQLAPLMMMAVFSFVFTVMMPNSIALFPIFFIAGLLPWNYCAEAVTGGTRSVIDNAHLIKKIFFPREILPLVSVLSSLLNFVLSLPMMFVVMVVVQFVMIGHLNISWTIFYLPVVILLQTLFLLGLTMFLSSLAVFFRDIVHLVGIFVLFWFFLTPVFYALDTVGTPAMARIIRWLNPMASIIEFYRETLYGNTVPVGMIPTPGFPAADSVLRVTVTALLMLALGYWFFNRQSGQFGEEL